MRRYDLCNNSYVQLTEKGEFVKYDDIRHILERSDNSDYAVTPSASPKLPSLSDVIEKTCKELKSQGKNYDMSSITETFLSVKNLGNFA